MGSAGGRCPCDMPGRSALCTSKRGPPQSTCSSTGRRATVAHRCGLR